MRSAPKSERTIETLRQRADFVRLRRGRRSNAPSFLLQSMPNDQGVVRVGYTVTKKIGNAVTRNRIKRRFRAAFRLAALDAAEPITGRDYVLIARPGAEGRAWPALLDDVHRALKHAAGGDAPDAG